MGDRSPDALAERLFEGSIAFFDLMAVYAGDRLGLYSALEKQGPATADELSQRTGIDARYAREWLEQQAASDLLDVDDVSAPPDKRRFALSPEHAQVLTDPDSPFSMTPLARSLVATAQRMPEIFDAFRTGKGIDWTDFGQDMIESQGDFNRPWLRASLGTEYLPSIQDVHDKLSSRAKVADFACGVGWAAISIAEAYPNVEVDGFDLDESSIALARKFAAEAGVADRTRFEVQDIADESLAGTYDLAIAIESIHDLARPVEALASMRRILAPGGVAIVADEKTADTFTAPADPVERLFYGFSVFVCLPAGRHEQPSAATGTVMRADTMRAYASEAGFASVEVLDDIDHDFLRFYRLNP